MYSDHLYSISQWVVSAHTISVTNWHTFDKSCWLWNAENLIYVPASQPLYSGITEPLQQTSGDLGSVAASCPAERVQPLRCTDRGINCVARKHFKSDTWQPCNLLWTNKQQHAMRRLHVGCQLDAGQVHCIICVQIKERIKIIRGEPLTLELNSEAKKIDKCLGALSLTGNKMCYGNTSSVILFYQ